MPSTIHMINQDELHELYSYMHKNSFDQTTAFIS